MRSLWAILQLTLLLELCAAKATADPGDLDPSFDGDGRVLTDFRGFDRASALIVQRDGKLVAAGARTDGAGIDDFFVARYREDGSLDSSFGGIRGVSTDFGSGGRDEALALASQPDGKIVVAGFSSANRDRTEDFAVARYNSDGSLDDTFDSDGGDSSTSAGKPTWPTPWSCSQTAGWWLPVQLC